MTHPFVIAAIDAMEVPAATPSEAFIPPTRLTALVTAAASDHKGDQECASALVLAAMQLHGKGLKRAADQLFELVRASVGDAGLERVVTQTNDASRGKALLTDTLAPPSKGFGVGRRR